MDESMGTLYVLCATVGGTILVVQTALLALGAGHDADTDVDPGDLHDGSLDHGSGHGPAHDHGDAHGADSFLRLISFKTLVAFVTFFGLAGLASQQAGYASIPTLGVAVASGSVGLYAVAYLMAAMSKLQSKGNLDVRNAVGQSAKVYLRVPSERSGRGKVTVSVQGRRVELKAVTSGPEIPTGAEVRVVGTASSDTLEVERAERS